MKRSGPREARLHEFYKKILKDFCFFISFTAPSIPLDIPLVLRTSGMPGEFSYKVLVEVCF